MLGQDSPEAIAQLVNDIAAGKPVVVRKAGKYNGVPCLPGDQVVLAGVPQLRLRQLIENEHIKSIGVFEAQHAKAERRKQPDRRGELELALTNARSVEAAALAELAGAQADAGEIQARLDEARAEHARSEAEFQAATGGDASRAERFRLMRASVEHDAAKVRAWTEQADAAAARVKKAQVALKPATAHRKKAEAALSALSG